MQETWGCSLGTQRGWLHRKPCYWSGRRSCCSVTQAQTISRESRSEAWAISGPLLQSPHQTRRRACDRRLFANRLHNRENVTSAAFVAHCRLGHDLKEATRHFHTCAQPQQRLSVKTHKRIETHKLAPLCLVQTKQPFTLSCASTAALWLFYFTCVTYIWFYCRFYLS